LKVAIIGSRGYPYVYSGYETFVKEISERLVKKNFKITVYCHKGLFENHPKSFNGIDLIYFPTIEKKSLSQFIHSLQSILHACFKNYDIIFILNSANGLFGLFTKILNKKTVINVDGLEWLRPKWKGLGAKYFYFASKLASKFYDFVITDSYEMQKIYETEFNAKSKVIAYGANISYSKNPGLISKYGLKKENYYLIVGRLIPDNNVELIVKEFISSKSKKKLVIVGDVPYKDKYAQNIKKYKDERLIFTGYVKNQNELAELYHNCFVYLHGHEFGGTNPTMLEALACGCAIFAIDTVFSREMLDNENYGVFFSKEGGNLKNLIEKVEQQDNLLKEYRSKSRNRITENYTWDKITGQYADLFQSIIFK
jgi:glycosyltransferase involved in cell wall biosynthesis